MFCLFKMYKMYINNSSSCKAGLIAPQNGGECSIFWGVVCYVIGFRMLLGHPGTFPARQELVHVLLLLVVLLTLFG